MNEQTKKVIAIYGSGFLIGLALILYPAAGNLMTDARYHGLSSGTFGVLFIPQVITAIVSSLLTPLLAKRIGMVRVWRWGLIFIVLSMLLFALSALGVGNPSLSFGILMVGTAALGACFGFTVSPLNPFAYELFPGREASAVTGLHIFIGLGTACSPLLLQLFQSIGMWWGAGLAIAAMTLGMMWFKSNLPLVLKASTLATTDASPGTPVPVRIWLYVVLIFFTCSCEATFGNWSGIYLEKQAGLSLATAALGLSLFWGGMTAGRVLFSLAALRYSTAGIYLLTPFLVTGIMYVMPYLNGTVQHLLAVGLVGLFLSFYFPNTYSVVTTEFPAHATLISAALVASIQVATGVSAQLIGQLSAYVPLSTIFQYSALYALLAGVLSLYLHWTKPAPSVLNR
jgi:fucose permease